MEHKLPLLETHGTFCWKQKSRAACELLWGEPEFMLCLGINPTFSSGERGMPKEQTPAQLSRRAGCRGVTLQV